MPTVDQDEVLKIVESWSQEERRLFLERVEATLDPIDEDDELTDEMKAEFDRRIAEHRANPETGLLWDDVKDQVFERLGI